MRHYFSRSKPVRSASNASKSFRWNELCAISVPNLVSGPTHWIVTCLANPTAVSWNSYIEGSMELKRFTSIRKWEI